MLGFNRIIDQQNSITYVPDFLNALEFLINKEAYGIYNIVNKETLSLVELLQSYNEYTGKTVKKEIIKTEDLGLNRTNVRLSTNKLEESGFNVRSIHDCLPECLKSYTGGNTQ